MGTNNSVYIHDLDSYPITTNCITNVKDTLKELFKEHTVVVGGVGTGKSFAMMKNAILGDIIMKPVIINRKIMKDIVSIRFSDTTIVIMSRTDYDENEIFFEDLTKEEIIREFALEVY